MSLIQIILLSALFFALLLTWRRARQDALSRPAAFVWSLFWFASAGLVLRPEVSSAFASLLGVGRGVDAVLYLLIPLFVYGLFRLFLHIDRIERDLTKLVTALALKELEAREEPKKPSETR